MTSKVYITATAAVTNQQPFSDDWLDKPVDNQGNYVRAIEPDMKDFLPPAEARRMCRLLRRAVAVSLKTVENASFSEPDAIITGTGMGCMENSEKFLIDMSKYGEQMLKPSLFMQSTHNTISSQIAILLKCHGYNITYSSMSSSFESALLDAWLKISSGRIATALVGSHDEVTPLTALLLEQLYKRCRLISEASVAFALTSDNAGALCSVDGVRILHLPDEDALGQAICSLTYGREIDLVLDGCNGNPDNDRLYDRIRTIFFQDSMRWSYKNLFGENFSASAVGCHAGATILSTGRMPLCSGCDPDRRIKTILILNHSDGIDWTAVLLSSV